MAARNEEQPGVDLASGHLGYQLESPGLTPPQRVGDLGYSGLYLRCEPERHAQVGVGWVSRCVGEPRVLHGAFELRQFNVGASAVRVRRPEDVDADVFVSMDDDRGAAVHVSAIRWLE
jgi:hypothetical protein